MTLYIPPFNQTIDALEVCLAATQAARHTAISEHPLSRKDAAIASCTIEDALALHALNGAIHDTFRYMIDLQNGMVDGLKAIQATLLKQEQSKIVDAIKRTFPDRVPGKYAGGQVILKHDLGLDMQAVLSVVLEHDKSLALVDLVKHPLHGIVYASDEHLDGNGWYLFSCLHKTTKEYVSHQELCAKIFHALPKEYLANNYSFFGYLKLQEPEDYDSEAAWKQALLDVRKDEHRPAYDNFLQSYRRFTTHI